MPRTLLLALGLALAALVGWLVNDLRAAPSAATAVVDAPLEALPAPPAVRAPEPAAAPAPAATPPRATRKRRARPRARLRPAPSRTAQLVPRAQPVPGAGRSRALGLPFRRGRLVRGVLLPAEGPDHVTWDAPLQRSPNRSWRRWGTDVLVATVLQVLADHRAANPGAPRVLVGDLSRPRGGVFDSRFGGLGHASHQNGLDVDIPYPRRDRRLAEPRRPADVDRLLAQDLVDRFLAAGAEVVFVGRRVGLRGIGGRGSRVQAIAHHEDHLHVRLPNPDPRR